MEILFQLGGILEDKILAQFSARSRGFFSVFRISETRKTIGPYGCRGRMAARYTGREYALDPAFSGSGLEDAQGSVHKKASLYLSANR